MGQTIDVENLAIFFGKTARTVQLWAENDGMPREERGVYDLEKCASWRIRKLEEECEMLRNSGDENLHALKIEGQRIANKEREVKLRRAMGELVVAEDVRMAWLNETKVFRKALLSMVNKLSDSLENIQDSVQRKQTIDQEVRDVLSMIGDLEIETEDSEDILNDIYNEKDEEE